VAAHGCVDGGGALVAVAGLDFGVESGLRIKYYFVNAVSLMN